MRIHVYFSGKQHPLGKLKKRRKRYDFLFSAVRLSDFGWMRMGPQKARLHGDVSFTAGGVGGRQI